MGGLLRVQASNSTNMEYDMEYKNEMINKRFTINDFTNIRNKFLSESIDKGVEMLPDLEKQGIYLNGADAINSSYEDVVNDALDKKINKMIHLSF